MMYISYLSRALPVRMRHSSATRKPSKRSRHPCAGEGENLPNQVHFSTLMMKSGEIQSTETKTAKCNWPLVLDFRQITG